jgi:chromate reductase
MSNLTLLGLSGSLRKQSTNRRLLREAARLFGEANFIEGDLNLPLYNGDEEDADGVPTSVQILADQIAAADAILISTPEYNKGLSGVLKNALDWVSRTKGGPWAGKPVAVMSAAAGRAGGVSAQMTLRTCMGPFRPRILQGPEVHLANCSNEFDGNGHLSSEVYTKALSDLMSALRVEISL